MTLQAVGIASCTRNRRSSRGLSVLPKVKGWSEVVAGTAEPNAVGGQARPSSGRRRRHTHPSLRWCACLALSVCASAASTFATASENRAPVVHGQVGPLTLTERGKPARIALEDLVTDPDGDPLGYGMAIPAFVGLGFDGAVLTVTPLKQGSETITIRAADPSGLYAELGFSVTVRPANKAPVVLAPIDDLTLTVGGRTGTIALPSHFRDPEGEELSFSATSASSETVTAAIAKDVLIVSAVTSGKTAVTVVASDPKGSRSPAVVFSVNAMAPVPVRIPDAKLRSGLESWLEKEAGETIDNAEMERLETFLCESCGVSDLTGLESAISLSDLQLDENAVTKLTPLSGLTNLVELVLSNNPVRDLSPLQALPGLRILNLSETQMKDASSLSGLVNVTGLYLSRNLISDLTPLAGLSALTELSLFDNVITDIRPLSGLVSLRELNLEGNCVTSVKPLASNAGLGPGDTVRLRENSLSADVIANDVTTLRDRGVNVVVSEIPSVRVAAPTHLIAMPGDGKLTLRWPGSRAAVDVAVYEVRWRSATGTFNEWLVVPCSSKRRHELGGLVNGTTYTVEVRPAGNAHNGVRRVAGTPTSAAVAMPVETKLTAALTAPGTVPSVSEVNPYDGWEIFANGVWRLRDAYGTSYQPAVYFRELRIVPKPPPEELGTQVRVRLSTSPTGSLAPVPWMFGWRITFAVHDRGLDEALVDKDGVPLVTAPLNALGSGWFAGTLQGDTDTFWAAISDSGDYDRDEGLYVELRPRSQPRVRRGGLGDHSSGGGA